MRSRRPARAPNRNGDDELRARARLALDAEPSAQLVDAFAHALQPEVAVRCARVPLPQPASIVSNHEIRFMTSEAQLDIDATGVGVLQGVGEPLETDAQQVMFLGDIEALRLS
jgi:hypothetical protein